HRFAGSHAALDLFWRNPQRRFGGLMGCGHVTSPRKVAGGDCAGRTRERCKSCSLLQHPTRTLPAGPIPAPWGLGAPAGESASEVLGRTSPPRTQAPYPCERPLLHARRETGKAAARRLFTRVSGRVVPFGVAVKAVGLEPTTYGLKVRCSTG